MVCRQRQLENIQFEIFTWSKTERKKRADYLFIYFIFFHWYAQAYNCELMTMGWEDIKCRKLIRIQTHIYTHWHLLAFHTDTETIEMKKQMWNEGKRMNRCCFSALLFCVYFVFVARFCFASSSYIIEMNVWCHSQLYIFAFKTAPLQTYTYMHIPHVLFNYSLAIKRF